MNAIDKVTAEQVPLIEVDGLRFRDLDGDGTLAPYEDWRRPAGERVDDLIGRMTVAEKVGTMLHGTLAATDGPLAIVGRGVAYDLSAARDLIVDRGVTSAITRITTTPSEFAEQNNLLQAIAAEGRLGIPLTISSDPRHHISEVFGATVSTTGFTQWPEPLGLGAIGDSETMRQFGDCVRVEYRAVGIHMSLAPQADLGTSPRWPRIEGTFGQDPELVNRLAGAYIEGAQGGRNGLHPESVACVVKHWVGYGASRDGFDGHNYYGRFSAFPAGAFQDHVRAFGDALDFAVAGVMPTYNILDGLSLDGVPLEAVGAGFSGQLIDGLLRASHRFEGLVLSDWAITRDANESCRTGNPPQQPQDIAMCWGVEDLSRVERFAKAINAGVDQLGGEDDPVPLLEAVEAGYVPMRRIDQAVRRVLIQKFELGLFERPFVDPTQAGSRVGTESATARAVDGQRRSLVRLSGTQTPIVSAEETVYCQGPLSDHLRHRGIAVTDDPALADRVVIVTATPHEMLHPNHFFGRFQHEGDLDFKPSSDERLRIDAALTSAPTVIVIHMDRPAVLGPFMDRAETIVVELGTSLDVLADALVDNQALEGRLPFTIFGSMDQVIASPCDRPATDGRFPVGFRATSRSAPADRG